MQLPPVNIAEAKEYALAYFKGIDMPVQYVAADYHGEHGQGAVNVLFDGPHGPIEMMVWLETRPDGTQYLYGEW